jgi:hypothetical protein
MIEETLYCLGMHLCSKYSLPKKQVGFIDKENLFNFLNENKFPLTLPAVAYSISDISFTWKKLQATSSVNSTLNAVNLVELIPVILTVNIALVTSTTSDYFDMLTKYILEGQSGTFTTRVALDDSTHLEMVTNINETSALTTPPFGREGKDYDRGVFYVLEGNFKVQSFVIREIQSQAVVRKINVNWDIGLQFETTIR